MSKLIADRHPFWGKWISNYRYRIVLPEELISMTETDLWECQQKISHYRYRFSLESKLISITATDFGLKTNWFCNHFGYNGRGALNLAAFGIPVFGTPDFGIPVFGIPDFGIPGFGISVSGRVPVWVFPVLGIPAVGIPAFGIPTFGICSRIQAPVNQTSLRLPPIIIRCRPLCLCTLLSVTIGNWVHQNRAILWGCGGDFHRSLAVSRDF